MNNFPKIPTPNISLLSIHIPKTAGSSFYDVLTQVYGAKTSISYKRKHLSSLSVNGQILLQQLPLEISVLHGHFYYKEVKAVHLATNAKIVCWLRNPVDRLISNYDFFIAGLHNPTRNPMNYERNKHRINEDILTYARKEENKNRMHCFLEGINLEDFFFIGRKEKFSEDINRLGKLLHWPEVKVQHLNKKTIATSPFLYDTNIRKELAVLNHLDVALYQKAMTLM